MNPPSGTQLSFLTDTHQDRPKITTPSMASNVLLRLLDQAGMAATTSTTPAPAVTFLRTIFPWAVIAAERTSGLPVTKTTLQPFLENPMRAIILTPPRPEEIDQVEAVLEFVQRRLAAPEHQAQIAAALAELLGPRTSELLITPDSIPSPLFATARSEAASLFTPLLGTDEPEAIEYLVEASVLLQANHSDVPAGIEKLFWRQDTAAAALFAAGCADGRARAYFRELSLQSAEKQKRIRAAIKAEMLATAFGEQE
ncbi:MAG TPA: hypothetical protein VMC06_13210 [Opitutaceae bacterium]|nr:hypothetical protein [Opitutaceae bacterium]